MGEAGQGEEPADHAVSKGIIHYSRCHLAPTASSLAYQLGYLQEAQADLGDTIIIDLKLGDYAHNGDRFWMRHAANAKALWARSRGADTRAVAFSWYESTLPIFALPRGGIAAPADLKGRRIAAIHVRGQSFDYDRMVYLKPFVAALRSARLSLSDVVVVDTIVERELIRSVAPASKNFNLQMADLFLTQLLRGEVDAVAASLPPEVVRFFELTKVYDGRADPDANARVDLRALVVSGSVVREHREALVGIVASLMRTGRWATENPGDVLALIARDVSTEEAVLRDRGIDFVRASQVDVTEDLVGLMGRRKDFLLETGLLERDFSVEEWIDESIVRDARAMPESRSAPSLNEGLR
jgi:sulfonate transport system substrate-binding protein